MHSILVTGGCGFIGSNFIHYMLRMRPACRVVNLDCLTYAGNLKNLAAVEKNPNYTFYKVDILDGEAVAAICRKEDVDAIVHFAAESHVDRSIHEASAFVRTNVLGTQMLLDVARGIPGCRYLQISTDEVYGSLGPKGKFTETTPIAPNSPYSASKAGADLLVRSYFQTHGLDAVITRCSNNYGPFQFPEKLIPVFITNAMEDQPLPLYGDGMNIRDWIYVEDHCSALLAVLENGRSGEVYNVGGGNERTNMEITKVILNALEKPESLITFVKDRPGHDRRYAIDSTKIESELGWKPQYSFEEGMRLTVAWYLEHESWWREIKNGAYQSYYQDHYLERHGMTS